MEYKMPKALKLKMKVKKAGDNPMKKGGKMTLRKAGKSSSTSMDMKMFRKEDERKTNAIGSKAAKSMKYEEIIKRMKKMK